MQYIRFPIIIGKPIERCFDFITLTDKALKTFKSYQFNVIPTAFTPTAEISLKNGKNGNDHYPEKKWKERICIFFN